jgi:secreted trypsin-like serine protease
MKLAAALVATTAAVGAAQAYDITPLILGGTVVPSGTKTYTTGIRQTATGSDFCGGSLITPTHVLTAGHCYGYAKYVAVGTHYLSGSSDGVRVAVKKETRHPSFSSSSLTYDYTIIELATAVTAYAPVKLLTADPLNSAGSTATTMGWGTTSSGGTQSTELLRVDVPILTDAACKAAGLSGTISSTMFCAGGKTNKDSCQGDSGGPIILEKSTGDVLIGVVSWGDGCGVAGKPGVYGKVSSAKTWIQSIAPNATFV